MASNIIVCFPVFFSDSPCLINSLCTDTPCNKNSTDNCPQRRKRECKSMLIGAFLYCHTNSLAQAFSSPFCSASMVSDGTIVFILPRPPLTSNHTTQPIIPTRLSAPTLSKSASWPLGVKPRQIPIVQLGRPGC